MRRKLQSMDPNPKASIEPVKGTLKNSPSVVRSMPGCLGQVLDLPGTYPYGPYGVWGLGQFRGLGFGGSGFGGLGLGALGLYVPGALKRYTRISRTPPIMKCMNPTIDVINILRVCCTLKPQCPDKCPRVIPKLYTLIRDQYPVSKAPSKKNPKRLKQDPKPLRLQRR